MVSETGRQRSNSGNGLTRSTGLPLMLTCSHLRWSEKLLNLLIMGLGFWSEATTPKKKHILSSEQISLFDDEPREQQRRKGCLPNLLNKIQTLFLAF